MTQKVKIALSIVAWIVVEAMSIGFWYSQPVGAETILLVLLALLIVLSASKHAYHYAFKRRAYIKPDMKRLDPDARVDFVLNHFELHRTQRWYEFLLFGMLILAGCDPFRVLGAQFIARVPFQGLINWSVGKPFVDKDEPKTYTVTKPDGSKEVVNKFFPGRRSLLKPVFGAALIWVSLWLQ